MTGKRLTAERRQHLHRLAAGQHGVVSRRQLRAAGWQEKAIDHAIAVERLHRVFRGVYAVGRPELTARGRLQAAVLACGKGAVVSHRSAGALLELLDEGPAVVDVIAPPARGRKIDGIRLHLVRPPRLEETGTMHGIPCTSPARTLVDLAGVVGEWTLRSAFERAARRHRLDVAAVEASVDPRRRGTKVLLGLIAEWRDAVPLLEKRGKLKSPLEAKVLPLLGRRNIPAPLFNAPVAIARGRIEADFLWPDQRFVLEADSRDFHGTHVAFERDRRRDRELMRAGYSVLRVTHHQAENEAEAVAETIASELFMSGLPLRLNAQSRPGRGDASRPA